MWYMCQQNISTLGKQHEKGRGSNTNYNYPNNLLKSFAAAKLMFPVFVRVQPCLVRTALQLSPTQGQPQHPRQAAQWMHCWFFTCAFLLFLGSKGFWGPILQAVKIDFICKFLCKIKAPHFLFWIPLWELMPAQLANKMDSSGLSVSSNCQ